MARYNSTRRCALLSGWIGASALWLGACGTEDIELRPGEVHEGPDGAEPTPPAAPVSPAPLASRPEGLAVATAPVGRGASSEGIPRELELVANDLPTPGDVGFTEEPASEAPAASCEKVDFLFVVDGSLSLREEQASLARSFGGFIQLVQNTLGVSDFHIMVVGTGGRGPSAVDLLEPSCDERRGAGRRISESGSSCNFASADRFLLRDQPELEQTFACVAQVGVEALPLEHPVDAMLDAISPALNQPEGCNAGFLRDDAALVITLISDEDDILSGGQPGDWQREVLARKGGNAEAVVTLGILADANLPGGVCHGLQSAPRLQSFAKGLGLVGSVCADDYSPLFQQAMGWLAARCADPAPTPSP